ncbi:MAG: hypothetical protein JNJ54_19255 [Myxococcaceae bacterium]|nr:hypothetical protein [Myxococcaceae bacterium]
MRLQVLGSCLVLLLACGEGLVEVARDDDLVASESADAGGEPASVSPLDAGAPTTTPDAGSLPGDAGATDPCAALACGPSSRCVAAPSPECVCDRGYHREGAACVADPSVDPCAGVSCGANARCTAAACACLGGYTGNPASGCTLAPTQVPADFAGVVWLHTNASGWARTANLSTVQVGASQVCLEYDKASAWPGLNHVGAFVNANPWIFVYRNGRWHAATWEWMRFGQTCKNRSSVHGSHIKRAPLDTFVPVSGETYGFMVTGLARDATRNVQERTQVVMVRWP